MLIFLIVDNRKADLSDFLMSTVQFIKLKCGAVLSHIFALSNLCTIDPFELLFEHCRKSSCQLITKLQTYINTLVAELNSKPKSETVLSPTLPGPQAQMLP